MEGYRRLMIATALIPFPLFYNPDERGKPESIEDEHFVRTVEQISERFRDGRYSREPRATEDRCERRVEGEIPAESDLREVDWSC